MIKRIGIVSLALCVLAGVFAVPCQAKSKGEILVQAAKWIGVQLGVYAGSEVVDRALGLDCESQLEEVQRELEARLAEGGVDRVPVEEQLSVVKSQLEILKRLLDEKALGKEEIEELRRRVQADLAQIRDLVGTNERRIGRIEDANEELKAHLAEHGQRIDSVEDKLDLVIRRLDLRTLSSLVTIQVGAFSLADDALPDSVAISAREALLEALSRDDRVLLSTSGSAPFDLLVEGTVIRGSTWAGTFSGFGTQPRPAVTTTFELSIRLLDSSASQNYLTKRYRQEKKRLLPPGSDPYEYGVAVAHDLAEEAIQEAVKDIFAFLFLEDL